MNALTDNFIDWNSHLEVLPLAAWILNSRALIRPAFETDTVPSPSLGLAYGPVAHLTGRALVSRRLRSEFKAKSTHESLDDNNQFQVHQPAIFLNNNCRELLGLKGKEAFKAGLLRHIHPDDQRDCLAAWNDFIDGNQARFEKTFRWIKRKRCFAGFTWLIVVS